MSNSSTNKLNAHSKRRLIHILLVKWSVSIYMYTVSNVYVCHRYIIIIISTAIDFGFIHREITQLKLFGNSGAWRVNGRAKALVVSGLATPLIKGHYKTLII